MTVPWWLWIVLTVIAAAAQTGRNAAQKGLTATLGTMGAIGVRFYFGLPFALLSLLVMLAVTGEPLPRIDTRFAAWVVFGAGAQILATALMLAAMRLRSFVVATAYTKTDALQVALFALIVLHERTHLRRGDAWVNAAVAVWRCLFWFNPLFALAQRCLHEIGAL